MGDAKRVDLDALRSIGRVLAMGVALHGADDNAGTVRDAIAEIEAARAAPPSSTSFEPIALTIAREAFALAQKLAQGFVSVASEAYERGPSRAARLVAYRCACRAAFPVEATPVQIETGAHAMLAAEREPQP